MPQKPRSGSDELSGFMSKSAERFYVEIRRLIEDKLDPTLSDAKRQRALVRLGDLLASTMGTSDLAGRRRMLLQTDYRKKIHGWQEPARAAYQVPTSTNPIVPSVPFDEALIDMATRDPRLARSAAEVSRIYTREHGFAMAKSVDVEVTRRVQRYVARFLREGGDPPAVTKQIDELASWGRAYSETVFRTNVSTAYAHGRWQQALDPDLADFVVGMRRDPVGDSDTRPNHDFTLIARLDDPIWTDLSAPGGYNCRCSMEPYDILEAKRDRRLVNGRLPDAARPAGAYNDPGFTGKRIPGAGLWAAE